MSPLAIVVGAGIGGLAAAIALRKANFEVLVLERRNTVNEIGQALGLPPNATRVLRDFGMDLDALRPCIWRGMDVVNGSSLPMKLLVRQDDPNFDPEFPSLFAHRQDLHDALKDFAIRPHGEGHPVRIRHGCRVVAYEPSKGQVVLDSGEYITGELVVAADGIGSNAHKWVVGEEFPPELRGTAVLRFVVPTDLIQSTAATAPIKEVIYEDRSTLCLSDEPGRCGVLRYSCRSGTLQNISIYVPMTNARDATTLTIETVSKSEAIEIMRGVMDPCLTALPLLVDQDSMFLWKTSDRKPLSNFVKGKMILLGDACHPMQPTLGQGASMAIEDAGTLGIVLQNLPSMDDLPTRLDLWERLRMPRTGAAQLLARGRLIEDPWQDREDAFATAEAFMGKGNVPTTLIDMLAYFVRASPLREARDALADLVYWKELSDSKRDGANL